METRACLISFIASDILHFDYKQDAYIELVDVKASLDLYEELTPNGPVKVLLEFPEFSIVTSEAREYSAATELPAIAEAIVLHSLPHRILARFYVMFRKKKHPIKIFLKRDKAVKWLKSLG